MFTSASVLCAILGKPSDYNTISDVTTFPRAHIWRCSANPRKEKTRQQRDSIQISKLHVGNVVECKPRDSFNKRESFFLPFLYPAVFCNWFYSVWDKVAMHGKQLRPYFYTPACRDGKTDQKEEKDLNAMARIIRSHKLYVEQLDA